MSAGLLSRYPMHAPYIPGDRRPIAGRWRRLGQPAVDFLVRRNVHPDAVTWASLASALVAAALLLAARGTPGALLAAPLFILLRLFGNMADGMVALASGRASRIGEVVNEFPDRLSDIAVLAAAGYSGHARPAIGLWAAVVAVLVAYTGTLGKAVGTRREFSGIAAKQQRMFAVAAGCWTQWALLLAGRPVLLEIRAITLSFLDLALLWIVVAGCATVATRLGRIIAALPPRK